MALRTAASANTTSVANKPPDGSIFSSLVVGDIDTDVGVQSLLGNYSCICNLEARLSNDVIQVKQSDDTYVDLEDVMFALDDRSYRTSCNIKNTSTGGIRIRLSVAWN